MRVLADAHVSAAETCRLTTLLSGTLWVNTLYSLHVFPRIGPNTNVLPRQSVQIRACTREQRKATSPHALSIVPRWRQSCTLTCSIDEEVPPREWVWSSTANRNPLMYVRTLPQRVSTLRLGLDIFTILKIWHPTGSVCVDPFVRFALFHLTLYLLFLKRTVKKRKQNARKMPQENRVHITAVRTGERERRWGSQSVYTQKHLSCLKKQHFKAGSV